MEKNEVTLETLCVTVRNGAVMDTASGKRDDYDVSKNV